MSTAATPTIDWSDVQGMVLRGYGEYPFSTNLFLRVDDSAAARGWLNSLVTRITTSDRSKSTGGPYYCNIAFACAALKHLGLPESVLSSFPIAFTEGPASKNRTQILSEWNDDAPEKWDWGVDVEVILMLFAKDQDGIQAAAAAEQSLFKGVSLRFAPIATQLQPDRKEHFGFRDGISQPVIQGSPPPRDSTRASPMVYADANRIAAGEFILGYSNEYGVLPDTPDMTGDSDPRGILPTLKTASGSTVPDLGRNGSYLVVRQIAQHVVKFWTYLDKVTQDKNGQSRQQERDKLAGKLIGRWQGGAPIGTPKDDPKLSTFNDFVYEKDSDGMGCPFGAHIRRGNPRDTLGLANGEKSATALNLTKRHRLVRRGRSYGPRLKNPLVEDGQDRGLLFMCINANIERQFEFVQQTWINNPSFNGLYLERDPVFGFTSQANGTMTVPDKPARRQLTNLGDFVSLRGAGYFFLPSIRALRYLASA